MKHISSQEIEKKANLSELIQIMKLDFSQNLKTNAQVPLRSLIMRKEPLSFFGSMPAFSEKYNLFITKIAAFIKHDATQITNNTVNALVVALSGATGEIIATIDGNKLTQLKCAAVAGLVTDYCAKDDAKILSIIGTGTLAEATLKGVIAVRNIEEIKIYSRNILNVESFIYKMSNILSIRNIKLKACSSVCDAIDGADIINTATTSTIPILNQDINISEQMHINCMGAHTEQSREVSFELMNQSIIIVEDMQTSLKEAGIIHQNAIEIETLQNLNLVELKSKLTIFSSTGHGFLDLQTAAYIIGKI